MDMNYTRVWAVWIVELLLFTSGLAAPLPTENQARRCGFWIDALRGEPIAAADMIGDLRQARVVYLGEYHSIARHHALEKELLEALAREGPLVLAMEQFELTAQPALDAFNGGSLDLNGLVQRTDLARRWSGYTNYLSVLSSARQHGVPVLALNAPAEVIRAIGRGGLTNLTPGQRAQLPAEIVTDDPIYQRLLNQILAVHMSMDPQKLGPAYEAQVARDETMASRLADYLRSPAGLGRLALVICGQGHCEYGLGTAARVERRMPRITQRIVLFSESGDLELTPAERKEARDIEISHQFLRELGRVPGDYFHVIDLAP